MLATIIPRLLTMVLSWIQAGELRNQVYAQRERIEVLETALQDIERISASRTESSHRHKLITGIVRNTLDRAD